MSNTEQQGTFSYSYSASEQAELRRLREKYAPKVVSEEEDKMAKLRRLDGSVTKRATTISLIVGIVGTLISGCGMSLLMSELPSLLGVQENLVFPLGIGIGILGGTLSAVAYPIYNAIVRLMRKKLAPEILRLTDELLR